MIGSRSVVLILACLVGACAAEAGPTPELQIEEQAILDRGEAMLAAENGGDYAAALSFYATNAVIQGPGMPAITGIEAIRSMYDQVQAQEGPRPQGAYTDRIVEVAASGDLAWEQGAATTTFETPSGPLTIPSKHLIVWRKVVREWRVAALSYSVNEPPREVGSPETLP